MVQKRQIGNENVTEIQAKLHTHGLGMVNPISLSKVLS
jgi:hypothetical protein